MKRSTGRKKNTFELCSIVFPSLIAFLMVMPAARADGISALLAKDPLLPPLQCRADDLRQTLTDLSRKGGVRFIFGNGLESKTVTGNFDRLTVSQILESVADSCDLTYEGLAPNTILVQTRSQLPTVGAAGSHDDPSSAALSCGMKSQDSSTAAPVSLISSMPAQAIQAVLPVKKIRLESGVAMSDRMPPVDLSMRPGAMFSEANLTAMATAVPIDKWVRIPNWAGGCWGSSRQTNYYIYSYETKSKDFTAFDFEAKSLASFGFQRDRRGDLWQWDRANGWGKVELANSYHYSFHRAVEIDYRDEKEFIMHFVSTCFHVDKLDMRIKLVCQTQSIQYYTNPAPGVMRCRSLIKCFDENGMPKSLTKGSACSFKLQEFLPIDYARGENVRELFTQYLTRNSLQHLIPYQWN